jgi:hypothetical protein
MSITTPRLLRRPHTTRFAVQLLTASALGLLLSACGGSSSGDGTVGGTVSGLIAGTSVTIQNNSTDTLTLTSNAAYTFPTRIQSLSPFSVSVVTQPTGQSCAVSFPTGVIPTDGSTVNNVNIVCALSSSVGGTVSGLAAGTSVTLNLGDASLAVAANGTFAFPGVLTTGTAYAVTVSTQPAGQTCALTNASGTVAAGVQSQVAVNCQ